MNIQANLFVCLFCNILSASIRFLVTGTGFSNTQSGFLSIGTGILKSHSGFLSTGTGIPAKYGNSGSYSGSGCPLVTDVGGIELPRN